MPEKPDIISIDCNSSKFQNIVEILESAGAQCRVVPLPLANDTYFDDCDAVVISGGPHLFTDAGAETLREQFEFLGSLSCPVFGICLGHQAMALHHGAGVYLGEPRRETDAITLTGEHQLLDGIPDGASFREDHCEGIELPEGFTVLGWSAHYPVEIMADDQRCWYGVQFHPEVSGDVGRQLLSNFVRILNHRKQTGT